MAVLTIASLPVMLFDRCRVVATRGQWLAVGWLGVSDALNVVLFFAAYQRTSVAIAVLTHYLTPILVAVLAPLVVRERPQVRTYVAVALSFGGLVMLLEPWRAGLSRADAIGAALGAGSAVFYASNVLVNKRLAPVFSGSELTFYHGVVALPLLGAIVPAGAWEATSLRSATLVVLGGLGPGALGALLFVWGLRRIAASHASVLTLLEPLVAVVLAAAVFGEVLGPVPVLGATLILLGAAVVLRSKEPGGPENRIPSAA
jgi:drug/metabolite transporter (DMT)-like permease